MGKAGRLDEAATPAEGAVGDDSTKGSKKKPYPSREYIQSWYCPKDKLEILGKLDRLQEEWGVGKSELTVWLLENALELVDRGKIKPSKETVTRFRLD